MAHTHHQHSESDPHQDQHHRHENLSDANTAYFDAVAHNYDALPAARKLAKRLAEAMLRVYQFDEEKTEVMDFACGTGTCLAPVLQSTVRSYFDSQLESAK